MAMVPAPLVEIHTSPDDVPAIPAWFAELILLVRHFTQRGILDAIAQHVGLARGRAGHDGVIDFVAVPAATTVPPTHAIRRQSGLC